MIFLLLRIRINIKIVLSAELRLCLLEYSRYRNNLFFLLPGNSDNSENVFNFNFPEGYDFMDTMSNRLEDTGISG